LDRAFGQGEWFCIQGTLTSTHKAPIQGSDDKTIPATNRRINVPICFVVRIQDSKAVEVWEYNDQLGFLEQLGL
jgi:ketosteroid isomerase-like protein